MPPNAVALSTATVWPVPATSHHTNPPFSIPMSAATFSAVEPVMLDVPPPGTVILRLATVAPVPAASVDADVPGPWTPAASAQPMPPRADSMHGQHWYDENWVTPVAAGLFMYSILSLVVLMYLCVGGRLDSRLNMQPSDRMRRRQQERREREFWAPVGLEPRSRHSDPSPRTDRRNSIVTVLGDGDEADIATLRQELRAAGLEVSERTLRRQRRQYDGFDEANRIITWPGLQQLTVGETDAAYEAELERVRIRRSINEARYVARLSPEQRCARADATTADNMRASGVI